MGFAVRVLFFAQLKDVAGCSECSLAPNRPITADELWAALCGKFPGLAERRSSVRLARNSEYATPDALFHDTDEVALIPPVSGG